MKPPGAQPERNCGGIERFEGARGSGGEERRAGAGFGRRLLAGDRAVDRGAAILQTHQPVVVRSRRGSEYAGNHAFRRIDGMVVAHIIGKGAPELVRFWGEPPLVREPDVTLFGLERIDAPEQEFLNRSPMRRMAAADVKAKGAEQAARTTLTQMHADARQVVLHLDTDVIAQEEFPGVNVPGSGGLSF